MEAYQNAAFSPEERAKDLLGRMTLKEKVGQLNQRLYGFRIYERQGEDRKSTRLNSSHPDCLVRSRLPSWA